MTDRRKSTSAPWVDVSRSGTPGFAAGDRDKPVHAFWRDQLQPAGAMAIESGACVRCDIVQQRDQVILNAVEMRQALNRREHFGVRGTQCNADRKSVVEGKRVSVRVD